MKFILSRKGFDSSYGGHSSPILADGTMLSMPIPDSPKSKVERMDGAFAANEIAKLPRYEALNEISAWLKSQNNRWAKGLLEKSCHLDPDIRPDLWGENKPVDWVPLFGQSRNAQSHLSTQRVGEGDIFLFFGWFSAENQPKLQAKYPNGFHAIWGYMLIRKIHHVNKLEKDGSRKPCHCVRKMFCWHPHCLKVYDGKNALYEANEYGTFKFHEDLILTKDCGENPNKCRTHWDFDKLPWLKNGDISMSGNTPSPDGKDQNRQPGFKKEDGSLWEKDIDGREELAYFQSAPIGQEFVVCEGASQSPEVQEWFGKLKNHVQK